MLNRFLEQQALWKQDNKSELSLPKLQTLPVLQCGIKIVLAQIPKVLAWVINALLVLA
jgi:hypothetical protein